MEKFCLVLTGRMVDGHALAAVEARLAEAFALTPQAFREQVWQRTPLVIRRDLEAAAAADQAGQLNQHGAEAEVWPDAAPLVWLRRDGRVRGPLPQDALDHFGQAGDDWCPDGSTTWVPLGCAVDTPLPQGTAATRADTAPPPLPAAPMQRRPRRGRGLALVVLVVAALLLAAWFWLQRPGAPAARPAQTATYVPRPLHALPAVETPAAAACAASGHAAASDEERYLLTGGRRQLTGRAARNGATYVAEAVSYGGAGCSEPRYQLYLFHDGGFVGAGLPEGDATRAPAARFSLPDPLHLRYVAACRRSGSAVNRAQISTLVHEAGGWAVRTPAHADAC